MSNRKDCGMSSKSVGIYLGEIYSVVAFKDATVRVISTGPNNEELCRSCVALDRFEQFVVGNAPYNSWRRYAPNLVVSIRRLMGASISDPQVQLMKNNKEMYPYGIAKMAGGTDDSTVVIMNGKEYTPEQITAEILRQLKKDVSLKLGGEVTHAVITVPAYFNEKQMTATRKAAQLAGLKVQSLLSEPQAIAISYGVDRMAVNEDKAFLVYDFGGDSFDLAILIASGGDFIVAGTGGDHWLGGDDIDRLITEYVLAEAGKANNVDINKLIEELPERKKYAFQGELKNNLETAQKELNRSDEVTIGVYDLLEDEDGSPIDIDIKLTRDKYESIIRPLVLRTLNLIDELLERAAYSVDTIDKILLAGSASCIPLVRKMLCDKYGKDKILSSEKPMLAIAEGAAILSHSLGIEDECQNCGKTISTSTSGCSQRLQSIDFLQQVSVGEDGANQSCSTKHSYFIQPTDNANKIQYEKIFDENTPLPCEEYRRFFVNEPNQLIMCYNLFSDAEDDTFERLGQVYFLIEKGFPLNNRLNISFCLDKDETLTIRASLDNVKRPVKVIHGRGMCDSHCCNILMKKWKTSLSDTNNGHVLRSKIQMIIKDIIKSNPGPENPVWQTYEQQLAEYK